MKLERTPFASESRTRSLYLASLLAVVPATLPGEVLIGWDFSPLTGGGGSVMFASQRSSAVEEESLTKGSGIGGSTADHAFGGSNWNIVNPDLTQAVNANEYVTFGLRSKPGTTMSLASIGAFNIRRSPSGPTTGQLQFIVQTGESPEWVNVGSSVIWGSDNSSAGNPQTAINLTTYPELQNIPAETTVLFRIVSWGATTSGGTWYLNDPEDDSDLDFVIEGSTSGGDYLSWISGYEVEGLNGFTEDFDKDGLSNGVESVTGGNPEQFDPGIQLVSATANSVTFRHLRSDTVPSDVSASYEWSTDLVYWFPPGPGGGITVEIPEPGLINDGIPNDLIEVTATVTSGTAEKLYVRLKCELQ